MEPKDWIALAALVLGTINMLALWLMAGRKATTEQIERAGAALKNVDTRVTKLEATVDALPSKDSFHKLELDVSDVKGSMRVLEEGLKPLTAGMARIERFMDKIQFENSSSKARLK